MKYVTFAILSLFCASLSAAVITPVSVTASSTYGSYEQDNLINDSGLSVLGQHDTNWEHMWLSHYSDTSVSLTFDLGDLYSLSSSNIWQYNVDWALDRGVQSFDILGSTDGVTFNFISNANLTMAKVGLITPQSINFTALAEFIRFDITSNYGDLAYTGLSEVKFNGLSAVPEVPIPAAVFMFFPALLGFMGLRRKAKNTVA